MKDRKIKRGKEETRTWRSLRALRCIEVSFTLGFSGSGIIMDM